MSLSLDALSAPRPPSGRSRANPALVATGSNFPPERRCGWVGNGLVLPLQVDSRLCASGGKGCIGASDESPAKAVEHRDHIALDGERSTAWCRGGAFSIRSNSSGRDQRATSEYCSTRPKSLSCQMSSVSSKERRASIEADRLSGD